VSPGQGTGEVAAGHFGPEHIALVDEALYVAEHSCADYFKLSAGGWKALRFELGTGSALGPAEQSRRALAKLARYEARAWAPGAASHLWRICLQDGPVLAVARRDDLALLGLLTYVLTHELVHIVRFHRFEQLFDADPRHRPREEALVHRLTHDILRPLHASLGLAPVLERYRDMGQAPGLGRCWT